jgi:hypothetical protein
MSIFVVLKEIRLLTFNITIMDILLQYLNIGKQKQEYIKVKDAPCNSVYQAICPALEINMADKALAFRDYMEQTYRFNYLFVGIIDAKYCNRTARAVFSYVDFCQLTSGPGE